ncbi:gamma carbonic anhydrase family protein [Halanaerobiaceae bacterium Z-7014]|uniref:Gamma carbonic anhydrase family protein n=1 Tax=Halonatronomonas betaini TaxID=2778430 RepID=A0A931ATP6_9FIRM|nr:gamma carbonic anhydrase family protein [Halonatronomonas betaini]MBF8435991.1 gamma carbonic anhydrase family protein [Halonatronomonas betaini]
MNYSYNQLEPEIDESAYIAPGVRLIGNIKIGADCNIWPNVVGRGDMDKIIIGSGTNIQDNSTLHVDFDQPLIVGENVTVGHSAILHGCEIEDECLIGMGATILNDAKIGSGSIIGANALIPEGKEIPPNSLVVGLPGKIIRETTEEERKKIKESAKTYINLGREHKKSQKNS